LTAQSCVDDGAAQQSEDKSALGFEIDNSQNLLSL
jgi:hypothetical protein